MANRFTKPFTENIYDKTSELIVYGASVYCEIAFYTLQTLGITPDFFCDRAIEKDYYFDVKVIKPHELNLHKNAVIIIASSDYFQEIRKQLSDTGCKNLYNMNYLLNVKIDIGMLSARAADFYDKKEAYIIFFQYMNINRRIYFIVLGINIVCLMSFHEKYKRYCV